MYIKPIAFKKSISNKRPEKEYGYNLSTDLSFHICRIKIQKYFCDTGIFALHNERATGNEAIFSCQNGK